MDIRIVTGVGDNSLRGSAVTGELTYDTANAGVNVTAVTRAGRGHNTVVSTRINGHVVSAVSLTENTTEVGSLVHLERVNVVYALGDRNGLCAYKTNETAECSSFAVGGAFKGDVDRTLCGTTGDCGSTVDLTDKACDLGGNLTGVVVVNYSVYVSEGTVCSSCKSTNVARRSNSVCACRNCKIAYVSACELSECRSYTVNGNGVSVTVECALEFAIGLANCYVVCKVVCTVCFHSCKLFSVLYRGTFGRSRRYGNDSEQRCEHHCNDH